MEKETKGIKFVAYARKSTDQREKQITSIEDQLREIERIGADCIIVKTLTEKRSAKTLGRPVFAEMLQMILDKKVEGIICWKLNRLARNSVDGGQIIWMLQNGVIKEIRTDDGIYTPGSDMIMLYIHFGMANQFSINLSKDIKRGLKSRVMEGFRPCMAPIGYSNSHYGVKRTEKILVDEDRFPKVRKIFDLMLTGQYSAFQLVEIAEKELMLRNRGWGRRPDKPMTKSNIYRVLTNTFYYAEFEFPVGSGNWYTGTHQPMITKDEYDRVQFLLGRAGKPRPKTHIFAYTGLMRCAGCGARITCEEKWKHHKNGNTHHYVYYRCTGGKSPDCTEKSVEVKVLEKEIDEFLATIQIPPEFHEWAIGELKQLHEKEKSDRNNLLSVHQKDYDECVLKLDKLADMLLEGNVSNEMYKRKETSLIEQKTGLKRLLDGDDKRVDDWLKKLESTLTFAERAREEFAKGDIAKRRQILTALGTEHIMKGRHLYIQTEKPLLVLQEVVSETVRIRNTLEPPKDEEDKGHLKDSYAKSSLMWKCRESNPSPNPSLKESLRRVVSVIV
ncbi:MAG: recombinase family protein [Candidatus Kaiserbacteria bacterium]|nr:recombinase family protein [Candidatus Kaiserbacteria bacterium]